MTTLDRTIVRRRILVEIADYAPTSTTSEVYRTQIEEDLNAMLNPAGMEVISLLELELNETTPSVTEEPKPAMGATQGFLPLSKVEGVKKIDPTVI